MGELVFVLGSVVAYGVGSVSSGFLVARHAGVRDIRQHGSGNIGATNILRTLGWRAALPVLLLDALKGALGVLLLRALGGGAEWQALGGIAAMAGHVWPFTLGFRGGRGVATGIGVLVALDPLAAGAATLAFVVIVGASRYISLGSIVSGIPAVLTLLVRGASWLELGVVLIGVLIIVGRHTPNIARLRAGTESRLSFRGKSTPVAAGQPAPR